MKFSVFEKGVLALTAAFLCLTVGYFLGQRSVEPYSVSAETLWQRETTIRTAQTPEEFDPEIEPVNINTADADQLQTLPGIGQVRAEQIIAERETNGPFRFPEDILRVSGIGESTLEKIIDLITVS